MKILIKEIKKISKTVSIICLENEKGKTIDVIVPVEVGNLMEANLKLLSVNSIVDEKINQTQ